MGILTEYSNFDEKAKNYTIEFIETKSKLDELLEKLEQKETSIWRGMCASEFKLYTSLQRFWIQRDLPNNLDSVIDYLKIVGDSCRNWNGGLITKYFSNYKFNSNSFYSTLSILRHHNAPTPLLDFTKDPFIALFFASYNAQANYSKNKTSNYFSVYEIMDNHPISKHDFKSFINGYDLPIREASSGGLVKDENNIKGLKEHIINSENSVFDRIKYTKYFLLRDNPDDGYKYYIINNYNIVNQNGLFAAIFDPILPLEEVINEHIKDPSKVYLSRNYFICYEFHKSLKEYLLVRLNEIGINKDYIFPNLYDMAKQAELDFLNKRK